MRLRRPCEHDRYDDHSVYVTGFPAVDCPGGEFLPEDAIVIEKVGMKLNVWWCTEHGASFQQEAIPGAPTWDCWAGPIEDERCVPFQLVALAADQVGEPG